MSISRVVLAHVDGRLADLADALDHRDDPRDVGVVGEVVGRADRLPASLGRSNSGAEREAERGQQERRRRDRRRRPGRPRHEAPPGDRLALEGARRSRGPRCTWTSAVCSGEPFASRVPAGVTANDIDPVTPVRDRVAGQALGPAPCARRAAPGHTPPPGSGSPSACAWAQRGDDVGEDGDRLEVAERGQPREPERVQPVAGQQREVGVLGHARTRPVAVVLQVALADRLDERARTRRRAHGRARPGRGALARGGRVRREGSPPRRRAGRRRRAAPAASRRASAHPISANAAAAASSVRVTCSRCGRATGTTPRTATAAGRRRGRAAPGTTRRGPRGRRRPRRRSPAPALGEEHGQQARRARDLHGPRPRRLRSPSASAVVVAPRRG